MSEPTSTPLDLAQEEPQASSVRLVASLTVLALISGLLLALAYELTLPPIKAYQRESLQRAVYRVVPGSSQLQPLVLEGDTLKLVDLETAMERDAVYAAYDDAGAFKGYAIPAEGGGFQDVIALIYGFDPDQRHIVGMDVLESRETPGLGDKIFKDQAFVGQWSDRAVDPTLVPVKKGESQAANEVDCITGATISAKAVVRIINDSNAAWLQHLPAGAAAPALGTPAPGAPAAGEGN